MGSMFTSAEQKMKKREEQRVAKFMTFIDLILNLGFSVNHLTHEITGVKMFTAGHFLFW
jgi:hypothetical protein